MKPEQLPSHEIASDNIEQEEGTPIDVFIYNNEPAGQEDSEKFRKELCAMLNYYGKNIAFKAWEESRLSFAKEIGNDMSEDEQEEPIASSFEDFIKSYTPNN